MPFGFAEDDEMPFQRRQAVDAGVDQIDLNAMRDELEEARRKRQESR